MASARVAPWIRRLSEAASSPTRAKKKLSVLKLSDSGTDSQTKAQTWKKATRNFLDSVRFEIGLLAAVVLYTVAIFFDLGTRNIYFANGCTALTVCTNPNSPEAIECQTWIDVFLYIDVVLLTFFFLELIVRIYAFGVSYLRDCLAAFDGFIVVLSVILFIVQFATQRCSNMSGSGSISTAQLVARIARIVRVSRVFVLMNKLSSGQKIIKIVRQQGKYRRIGSHVDRVIDILTRLRKVAYTHEDRYNLGFIIDVIMSDQLYRFDVRAQHEQGGMSAEMIKFLGSEGMQDSDSSPQTAQKTTNPVIVSGYQQTPWVDKLLHDTQVAAALSTVGNWDFDIFALDAITGSHTMVALFVHLVHVHSLGEEINIPMPNLVRFLSKLSSGYGKHPFHSYLHACDTIHAVAFFLSQPRARLFVSAHDMYALLLAAAMHDYGHSALTNAFYVNTSDELAIKYNDSSILESHHLSTAFFIMLNESHNPLAGLTQDQYGQARQIIVQSVLGTDPKHHFDHMTRFKTRIGANAFESPERNDVRLFLTTSLYAADISAPAKPWKLAVQWAARQMIELFEQGDREAELGVAVSPFASRSETNISKCQTNFIGFMYFPFFEEYARFLGDRLSREITGHLEENARTWEKEGEEALGPLLRSVRPLPMEEAGPDDEHTQTPSSSTFRKRTVSIVPMAAARLRGSGRRDSTSAWFGASGRRDSVRKLTTEDSSPGTLMKQVSAANDTVSATQDESSQIRRLSSLSDTHNEPS